VIVFFVVQVRHNLLEPSSISSGPCAKIAVKL